MIEESVIQTKSRISINFNTRAKKKRDIYKKYYIWSHATCSCENREYLTSILTI